MLFKKCEVVAMEEFKQQAKEKLNPLKEEIHYSSLIKGLQQQILLMQIYCTNHLTENTKQYCKFLSVFVYGTSRIQQIFCMKSEHKAQVFKP